MQPFTNSKLPESFLEEVAASGLEALPELLSVLLNTAMRAERERYLGVGPYERSTERRSQANGFKPKTLQTRLGPLSLEIPQTRDSGFYPEALEKGQRSERALKLTLAEMYVQGVSTRKVEAILRELTGGEVSSTQVSRAMAELDPLLQTWRQRPLGECPYLILDARYEKVRLAGGVQEAAVLVAIGIRADGHRSVLGVSVAVSEHEVHWRSFLQSLVARGLGGVKLIVSDAHAGLKAARQAVLGGVPWQRCQFHLQQNAQAFITKTELKAPVAADIRAIFQAPDLTHAQELLRKTVQKYSKSQPKLAAWMEENLQEGFAVFAFPTAHQRLLRTSNLLERVNRELKRRSRVVGIFPNPDSCLRLLSANLMELSEQWESGKIYLSFDSD